MINANKLKNINALSDEDRLDYFVRKVCDFEVVWGLYLDGWAAAKSNDNLNVMPFWSESELAQICANSAWDKYEPKSILLDDFLGKWIPGMERDQMHIAVFPIQGHQGIIISPFNLKILIDEELEQYE